MHHVQLSSVVGGMDDILSGGKIFQRETEYSRQLLKFSVWKDKMLQLSCLGTKYFGGRSIPSSGLLTLCILYYTTCSNSQILQSLIRC